METQRYNQLVKSKSPYLLQHAFNPVNWYAWSNEAFEKAKNEDKPVFLSIGYATCHWCHVMAHESFEDEEVAGLLNEHFVSIKVDREERPDVDQIYMSACQAVTGRGGWPLSIFMTPDGKPFFAGTYFPKRARMGMPGFMEIVTQLAVLWQQDRKRLLDSGETITNSLKQIVHTTAESIAPGLETLKHGYEQLRETFDTRWGGFGSAPKFPTPHNLSFLLRWHKRSGETAALQMVEKTLQSMRRGGIFDHIGFGFHRYSVDERWLVPHFEKMLYDQALLALAYSEAYQVTLNEFYGKVAEEIFTYVIRDMTSPEGGFFCAEDADSEGEEGLFYVWRPEEIINHLGQDQGELFCRFYNITQEGNFEGGCSIPHISEIGEVFCKREGIALAEFEETLREGRQRLFEIREERIHPLKDDKILTAWNGLMIAALAQGFRASGNHSYQRTAYSSADFILDQMRDSRGGLYRRYREGDVAYSGFLEDYAFLVWGLIELYEAGFELRYLEEAVRINRTMIDLFWDETAGGFYFSGSDNERLIAQSKDLYDGATPSGNSVAVTNLLRLGRLTGESDLEIKADRMLKAFSRQVASHPMGYAHFLNACNLSIGPSQEIVIAGDPCNADTQEMVDYIQRMFLPNKVLIFLPLGKDSSEIEKIAPFLKDMKTGEDQPSIYWCEHFVCREPITDMETLKRAVAST